MNHLIYHITLLYGYIRNKLFPKKWPVYTKITENLYLGRLPLKNNSDHESLKKEGIGAVLSILQHFENHTKGLFSDPVTSSDLQAWGIDHLQIEAVDFQPLTMDAIEKGVEFIDAEIKRGKKVYVHCKAGRGRSAAIVVAYLAKKYPDTYRSVEEAVCFVEHLRPIITLKPDKIEGIKRWMTKTSVKGL